MTMLRSLIEFGSGFRRCVRGAVLIETAFVAPILITMALGGFEISRIVSRQHELQTGASEAEGIVLAANQGATTDEPTLKSIIQASLGLRSDQVTIARRFRCGTDSTLVASSTSCGTGQVVSTYIRLTLTDSYTPAWTSFGVGSTLDFNVVRTVQVS
jgi:Flp pilus assembly protein TadG